MKARYLLDSVILIDHLNGMEKATAWLESLTDGEAEISAITRAEVLAGAEEDEKPAVLLLLDSFACLSVDAAIADRAADLRRRHRWKLPDALQAALAQEHRLALATRNTKDFGPKRHAFVKVPYSI